MARSKALKEIVAEAKRLKRKYPNRFAHLKKSMRWTRGYIKQASAIYASKHRGHSPVGKPKKVGRTRLKPKGKHLVKYVEKTSTERVMAGKQKRRKKSRKYVMAGRRRSVGQTEPRRGGGMGLILGLGIGALAIFLLTRRTTTTTPTYPVTLPPLTQTSSYTRNTQSQDLVNYAIAAGLAIDAISKLIDRLNQSTDQEVSNIYDSVSTTGDIGVYI